MYFDSAVGVAADVVNDGGNAAVVVVSDDSERKNQRGKF